MAARRWSRTADWSRSNQTLASDRRSLCAKGRASPGTGRCGRPAAVSAAPTRPKGDPDPGWQRISWDEALDETAAALRRIAAESGPEAVAFGVTTSSGTALSDAQPWVDRLINAFGSPNNCNSMEICAWHRQFARAFTTGTGIGMPDYAEAGCILLWGHNPSTSLLAARDRIAEARARGAKLIVVDPRHVGFAVKADCWLPVRPGTDAALALAIAGIMIERGWFDVEFVRDWTNGPFLVREDNGPLLRADALAAGGGAGSSPGTRGGARAVLYDPATRAIDQPPVRLALIAAGLRVAGRDGPIACRPAFDLYAAQCRAMPPERAAAISGVDAGRDPRSGAAALAASAGGALHLDRARAAEQCDANRPGHRDPACADRQHRRRRRQPASRPSAGQRRVRHRAARPGAMAQGARSRRAPARAGPVGLDSIR